MTTCQGRAVVETHRFSESVLIIRVAAEFDVLGGLPDFFGAIPCIAVNEYHASACSCGVADEFHALGINRRDEADVKRAGFSHVASECARNEDAAQVTGRRAPCLHENLRSGENR